MLDIPEGAFCKKQIDNACEFIDEIYDWKYKKILKYVKNNSINNYIYIEYSYKQLGHGEEWFDEQCRDLEFDYEVINREILLKWQNLNKNSPFQEEEIAQIEKCVKEPIRTIFLKNTYKVNIYSEDINFYIHNVIGVDVSGGMELDNCAFEICNPYTGEILADFQNNKIDVPTYTEVLYELVTEHFPNAILVIERNSYGKNCPLC